MESWLTRAAGQLCRSSRSRSHEPTTQASIKLSASQSEVSIRRCVRGFENTQMDPGEEDHSAAVQCSSIDTASNLRLNLSMVVEELPAIL